jgi:acetoin utilization deacetylase AcuC-like enzyme
LSIHQDPRTLYPGTGFVEEIGAGDGEGYTVNVPMPPGSGDAEYAGVMHELFLPLSEAFKPELIAVSVGFDPLADDPLTQLQLSTSAYGWLARYVIEQAERMCKGRAVFVLEGGYALEASGRAAVNLVKVLTGERPNPPVKRQRLRVVDELKHLLVDNWPLK